MEMATNKTPLTLEKKVWLEMALEFGVRSWGEMGGTPAWLWGGSVRGWGWQRGGTGHGETALRLAKNPMLPFKLAMKSRRMGVGREAGLISG